MDTWTWSSRTFSRICVQIGAKLSELLVAQGPNIQISQFFIGTAKLPIIQQKIGKRAS